MNQVITANRLADGAVVFVGQRQMWVERLAEATVFSDQESSAAALLSAQKDEQANLVIDVYAVDVAARSGGLAPVKLREAIRAQGPTVKPEHGKPR
jgi:hypothetical protein